MDPTDRMPLDLVTPDLLVRHDRPGPRYTSYPTAVEFDDRFTAEHYAKRLAQANERGSDPLSLYVHIPFCKRRCSFCGCNVIISKRPEPVRKYLDYLFKEIDLLASALRDRRTLLQYHWGGGTPTYLDIAQMKALMSKVTDHFDIAPQAEVAIEIDPEVTTIEQLEAAREIGFNRLSIGVQDFTPKVLEAVRRAQSVEQTRLLLETARDLGFGSVNIDLIYGLPHQNPTNFATTLDKVIEMRPQRVAVYSFAYVPWIKRNQKELPVDYLPDRETKFALFALAIRAFLGAGYVQIGMDHFALPDDELGQASTSRKLHRNFMGYTVHRAPDMIGLGVSSIGSLCDAFAQNVKKAPQYYRAIDEGRFPIERGYVLSEDDRIRRHVITELMCNFRVNARQVSELFKIDFHNYFGSEIDELRAPGGQAEQGFVSVEQDGVEVLPLGRLFVRNVCMVFDAYLKKKNGDGQVFSRTV